MKQFITTNPETAKRMIYKILSQFSDSKQVEILDDIQANMIAEMKIFGSIKK